jgi:hypothetical protein
MSPHTTRWRLSLYDDVPTIRDLVIWSAMRTRRSYVTGPLRYVLTLAIGPAIVLTLRVATGQAQSLAARPAIAQAVGAAACATHSALALSRGSVQRLAVAKRALERVRRAGPKAEFPAMRLPLDPSALERALVGSRRSTEALKTQGFSPRTYACELTRLATAAFAVAAADTVHKIKAQPFPLGPHVMVRVPLVDSSVTGSTTWSKWLGIQERDVAFVRRHQAELGTAGLSVSALGMAGQLPVADARTFPIPGQGYFLDSTDVLGATGQPLRVLFISDGGDGAAFYSHNVAYQLFQLIAAVGLRRRVVVGQVTYPASLLSRWEQASPIIRSLKWDYVVLQEEGDVFALDIPGRIRREEVKGATDLMFRALPLYDRDIKAVGARMVFTVFGREKDQQDNIEAMTVAARSVGAIPAPTWAAWRDARMRDRRPPYRRTDSGRGTGHLDPDGHYLQALVFYRAITGQSPIGLPAPPVAVSPDSTFTLPAQDVELLQRAAASAFSTTTTSPSP